MNKSYVSQLHKCQTALKELNFGYRPEFFKPVFVEIEQKTLSAEELAEEIPKLLSKQGWIQFPSAVVQLPSNPKNNQLPLKAEACQDDTCWQLANSASNCWALNIIKVTECEAEQASHLAQTVHHLSTLANGALLSYKSLWAIDGETSPVCALSVFTGFKESN